MNLFTPLSWNDAGFIFTGILNTVYISLVAIIVGSILGLLVGFIRAESNKSINVIIRWFFRYSEICATDYSADTVYYFYRCNGISPRPFCCWLNYIVALYHGIYE